MAFWDWSTAPPSAILAVVAATGLVAGLARGFSGFGAGLIFIPIVSAAVGPRLAVPLLLIIDAILSVGMVPEAWRRADKREVATMAAGAFVGIPIGVAVLTWLDALTLRWMIVVVVVALLLLLVSGWRYRGQPRPPLTVAVGVVGGFFNGAAQVGGPPVIAYWLGGVAPALTVRANIVLYFEVTTVISAVNLYLGGLFVGELVPLALAAGPTYGLGIIVGSRLFGLASDTTFRRLSLALIALAAVLGLPLLDALLR